ncbi:Uncharacterized protein BP5553_08693 [Venustampulla echinocandica]|uniref:Uncharacterized protein n=1 Tax=Venustampulla echinocandica TaxID=2656787 RepID=A0A370TEY8_9HELO|nr:Uncharacterized protein BP5553_08693 [Venustampulla echinocandica]RDL33254.1 Uncharacterized protein BP5553_08693 [Venustampulla echinocandica]
MATAILKFYFLVPCLFALFVHGTSWPEPWPSHWLQKTPLQFEDPQQIPLSAGSSCQTSNITAFEMAKGRKIVGFATDAVEDLELPKIRPLNSSAGEQWEFDGVSEDGMQSFIFGFYRDPNYAILGAGNFRLSVEFAFADRTRFYEVYYPQRSVVETCPSVGTRGMWFDEQDGYRFAFQVNADMSEAIITLDSETIKGRAVIRSRALPVTADGHLWPAENATTAPVPYWHWSEPIPAGIVDVDVKIKGKQIAWSGMGGHERFWSAFSWFTCLRSLNSVRAMLGPYVLTYFGFKSNMAEDLSHQSVVLFKDGVPIFRSTLAVPSETEPYALVTKTYGGSVTGTLKDKVTGFQLELVSSATMQHYTFFVDHANLGFEYILGEGVGGSGFSGISRGGHVGLSQYTGIALTEALTFPKNSPLFRSNYIE